MRVLGIDPGITRCGIGIVEVDETRAASLIHYDVIRTDQSLATHFRLRTVADGIDRVIREYEPEVIAIERVFVQENLQSVTTTMQAMGAAMVCAGRAQLPLAIHTPSEVKASITGTGNAGKTQVQNMVARILRLAKPPRPADAADALAIAICHAWRGTGLQGARDDGEVNVTLSGGVRSRNQLTPAQKQWTQALATTRRKGAVDPRVQRKR